MRKIVFQTLWIITIINFLVFWVVAVAIGGDALNGYHSDGHYFLKNHGQLTEVSREVFFYSEWHAISVFVSYGILFLWMALVRRTAVGK